MATLTEATLRAEKYDHKLKANDTRFSRTVFLCHHDGSTLFFRSAFIMVYEKNWIICFTEHHGYHVYDVDDLITYRQFVAIDDLQELEQ